MARDSKELDLGERGKARTRPLVGLTVWGLPDRDWRSLLTGGSRSGVSKAKSWLLPGAAGGFEQSLPQLLSLAFLPVGGVALELKDTFRPRHEGALVIPTAICDLAAYASARRRVASWANPGATSFEDAALRVHAELGSPVESWAYGKGAATRQRVRLARVRTDHVDASRLRLWAELERTHPMRALDLGGWTALRGARLRGVVAEGLCGADPEWWRVAARWLERPGEEGERAWRSLAGATGRSLWRLASGATAPEEALSSQ